MSPNWRRGTAGHPVARGLARTAVAASVATHLRSLLKRGQMHRPSRRLCYLQPDRCGTGPFAAKDAAAVRMPNGSGSDVADCLPWLCSRTSPKGIGRRLRGQGLVPSAGPIQPRSCKTLWTPRRPPLSAFLSLIGRMPDRSMQQRRDTPAARIVTATTMSSGSGAPPAMTAILMRPEGDAPATAASRTPSAFPGLWPAGSSTGQPDERQSIWVRPDDRGRRPGPRHRRVA